MAQFCAETLLSDLREVELNDLQNRHLVDIYKLVKSSNTTWKDVVDSLLHHVHADPAGSWDDVPRWAFPKAFSVAYRKMQKCRDKASLDTFLDQPAELSRLCRPVQKRKATPLSTTSPKKSRFDALASEIVKETSEKIITDVTRLQRIVNEQRLEITQLRKENAKLLHNNNILTNKVRLYCGKRVNQNLKRKEAACKLWRQKCRLLTRKMSSSQPDMKKMSQSVLKLKDCNRKLKLRKKRKTQHLAKTDRHTHVKALVAAGKQIRYLESELDATQKDGDDAPIEVKLDGKTYSHDLREASYKLQSLGIAESKIGAVIETVVDKVAHKTLSGNLPSTSTQAKMAGEMKLLARDQLKDTIREQSDMTLKYDGTTKKGSHLTEIELSTGDQIMLAGVRRQCGASAKNYVDTINQALQDCASDSDTPILRNVSNTMTDRCATNAKVDRDLEQLKGGQLNSFRCAAHPLDTFAHSCELAVREYEKQHLSDVGGGRVHLFTKGSESLTHCLVRKLSDLFHNDQTGCRELLSAHLSERHPELGLQKEWLSRFVGNRFNILFVNAGRAFLFRKSIIDFFQHVHTPTNNLQSSLLTTLLKPEIAIGLRALGLLGVFFTVPWQQIISRDVSILEVNELFLEAKNKLLEWVNDPVNVVTGETSTAFKSVTLKKDVIVQSLLLTDTDSTDGTSNLIQAMSKNLLEVMQRQLHDQLPGGKFWEPSTELQQQSRSCQATNISGERVFGKVDAALKRAPNVTIDKVEAKLMYQSNNTAEWLDSKVDKSEAIRQARLHQRVLSQLEQKRNTDYQHQLKERLRCKRVALTEKESKKRDASEKMIEEALKLGLWHIGDIDEELANKSVTRKKQMLCIQIKVLTKVVGLPAEKITLSKASEADLKAHLIVLLSTDLSMEQQFLMNVMEEPTHVIGTAISHMWDVDGEKRVYEATISAYHQDTEEFEIACAQDTEPYYMSRSELVTDIVRADMTLLL